MASLQQPSEQSIRGPGHLPHLDSLRGLAALGVTIHHAHFESEPAGLLRTLLSWLRQGHFLVTFFIILSGFCLALPTLESDRLRSGTLRFIARRARRLLPAYYASLGLCLLLTTTLIGHQTGRHWDFAVPVTARSIVTHLFLVHNYDLADLYKINHVFWSIAVEWQIYFAFPILLWLKRWTGPWWTTAIALGLGYLGFYAVRQTAHVGLTPHFYGMFALGMLGAELAYGRRWGWARQEASWWTVAALSLVAMIAARRAVAPEVLDIPYGVACVSVLVAFSQPSRLRNWLEVRPLVALGTFSYSLYLVHAPIQHLIVEYGFEKFGLAPDREFLILALPGTVAILAISYGFHRLFERPFFTTRQAKERDDAVIHAAPLLEAREA